MSFSFQQDLNDYLKLSKELGLSQKIQMVRSQSNKPFLVYKIIGNYGYIQNHTVLCRYCNRKQTDLLKFLAENLACKLELFPQYIKTHGVIKTRLFKQIQKAFYQKEVLCAFCKSPETKREEDTVHCLQCARSYEMELGKRRK